MSIIGDLIGSLNSTFRIGLKGGGSRSLNFFNGFNGNLTWNPTANRTITVPDSSGRMGLTDANGAVFLGSIAFSSLASVGASLGSTQAIAWCPDYPGVGGTLATWTGSQWTIGNTTSKAYNWPILSSNAWKASTVYNEEVRSGDELYTKILSIVGTQAAYDFTGGIGAIYKGSSGGISAFASPYLYVKSPYVPVAAGEIWTVGFVYAALSSTAMPESTMYSQLFVNIYDSTAGSTVLQKVSAIDRWDFYTPPSGGLYPAVKGLEIRAISFTFVACSGFARFDIELSPSTTNAGIDAQVFVLGCFARSGSGSAIDNIQIKRGTRSEFNTQATNNQLYQGLPLLITDEARLAVGLSASSYQDFVKPSEVVKSVDSYLNVNSTNDLYYPLGVFNGTALATVAATANQMVAVPFVLEQTRVLDRIAFNVTTLTAGNAIVGIYSSALSSGLWLPSARLANGTSQSTGTTGVKADTLVSPLTLQGGVEYWAVIHASAAATFRASPLAGLRSLGISNALGTAHNVRFQVTRTYDGTLPATWPAGGAFGATSPPTVFARFSS